MKIRDRIKEFKRIPAGELLPNPKNWRTHPDKQKDVLRGVLAEIGYAGALLARETEDGGYMLLDGHLRAETTPEQEVPVLVLDLDENEADKLLALLDPISTLAGKNMKLLGELVSGIETDNRAINEMLNEMLETETYELPDPEDIKDVPIPTVFQIVIECESEEVQGKLFEEFRSRGLDCRILNM